MFSRRVIPITLNKDWNLIARTILPYDVNAGNYRRCSLDILQGESCVP